MADKKMKYFRELESLAIKNNRIAPKYYSKYNVKRGLRNADGTGVLVGLTEIGNVHGYYIEDDEKIPHKGRLQYRGYDIEDIVEGFQKENRYGFEESAYLVLFGELPDKKNLDKFKDLLAEYRYLPDNFVEDMILKSPSKDIMNKMASSTLALYTYDEDPDNLDIHNIVSQSVNLIGRLSTIAAYAYQAKRHYYENASLFIHIPERELSTAENFLQLIRPDKMYTPLEAEILDLALVLHMEHGGGNNSAFTTRVVSSSGTDTYSAIAAGIGSLKGPLHGGANNRVIKMIDDIMENVGDWTDEKQVKDYLVKILKKEAGDGSGKVYGMGHAVYTKSDPRAILLKDKAMELSREKGREQEFNLYSMIESLTPEAFFEVKGVEKDLCANVDLYSGLVYDMLNIPRELYTPIFAMSRIVGWTAHRIEELLSSSRIIRPAYKAVVKNRDYKPMSERK